MSSELRHQFENRELCDHRLFVSSRLLRRKRTGMHRVSSELEVFQWQHNLHMQHRICHGQWSLHYVRSGLQWSYVHTVPCRHLQRNPRRCCLYFMPFQQKLAGSQHSRYRLLLPRRHGERKRSLLAVRTQHVCFSQPTVPRPAPRKPAFYCFRRRRLEPQVFPF